MKGRTLGYAKAFPSGHSVQRNLESEASGLKQLAKKYKKKIGKNLTKSERMKQKLDLFQIPHFFRVLVDVFCERFY